MPFRNGGAGERPPLLNVFDAREQRHFESGRARHVLDAVLRPSVLGPLYTGGMGPWLSEGSKVVLQPVSPDWPPVEVFFFEHMLLHWQIRVRVYAIDGTTRDHRWTTSLTSPEGADADLAGQLLEMLIAGGAPLPLHPQAPG